MLRRRIRWVNGLLPGHDLARTLWRPVPEQPGRCYADNEPAQRDRDCWILKNSSHRLPPFAVALRMGRRCSRFER
jgi:hypothetical protein